MVRCIIVSRDYISIAGIIMSRAGDTLHVTDTIKEYQRGGMQTHVFYYMILVTWIRRYMHWNLTASNNRDSIKGGIQYVLLHDNT